MTQANNKKLIVWCQFFYPELISTGQVVTELFESFSKSIDINVLCAQPSIVKAEKTPRFLVYSNIKVERVWSTCFSKLSLTGKICNQFTYACSLFWKSLTLPNKSHINVFTDPFFLPLLLYFINPIKKFRYTITLFDLYPETLAEYRVLSREGIVYRLVDKMTNKVFANASSIITIGRCMQGIVANRPVKWKREPVFIPIWCDTNNIRRKTLSPTHFKVLWDVTEDSFIVGYSGNLAKFHPVETFVHAADILKNQKDIKFVFVGEGAKKEYAQSYCDKNNLLNCHFSTYVERDQLGSLLAEFDCGLVGLEHNQTGLSVPSKTVALLAAGVPVIACVDDVSETAFMINENDCGYVCPPKDSRKLAKLILELKEDKKQCGIFRANALNATETKYHINMIVKEYEKIIDSSV